MTEFRYGYSRRRTADVAGRRARINGARSCKAGTETGKYPFVVHGLTGEDYSIKSIKALKAIALKHLTTDGKILAIYCLKTFVNNFPFINPKNMKILQLDASDYNESNEL